MKIRDLSKFSIESPSPNIRKKGFQIRDNQDIERSRRAGFRLQTFLNLMNQLVDEIEILEEKCIIILMKLKFEIKYVISVQDIGKIGSTTLMLKWAITKIFLKG
jgi:hypothetical protein